MADIDLESLEAIIKKEKEDKHHRHKRRSSSKDKGRHSHSSNRNHRHRRNRSKSEEKEREKSRSRSRDRDKIKNKPFDPSKKQQEALEKQIQEARKQAEEAQRDDCTVLVQRLHLDCDERVVYNFFSKANVGKVRDVRIIRDQRSGRSKGVGYVEFYTPESVLMAMTLSGQTLMDQDIVVQASQAEKNRAAAAAKYKKDYNTQKTQKPPEAGEGPMRIYVGGLTEALAEIGENDLKQLFEPFGDIEFIDLHRDPLTNKCKGFAFIQFRLGKDAKEALRKMNGFAINGKVIKVGIANEGVRPSPAGGQTLANELEEEANSQFLHSSESRAVLMAKLTRNNAESSNNSGASAATLAEHNVQNSPSCCLLLNNLFDHHDVDLKKEPSFFLDVKEDVIDACSDFGPVERVWVDQNSEGNVWVKYANINIAGATKALQKLNKRYFAGRIIAVNFVPESVFNSKVNL